MHKIYQITYNLGICNSFNFTNIRNKILFLKYKIYTYCTVTMDLHWKAPPQQDTLRPISSWQWHLAIDCANVKERSRGGIRRFISQTHYEQKCSYVFIQDSVRPENVDVSDEAILLDLIIKDIDSVRDTLATEFGNKLQTYIFFLICFYKIDKIKAQQQHLGSQIHYEHSPEISTWQRQNVFVFCFFLTFPHSNTERETQTWHMV